MAVARGRQGSLGHHLSSQAQRHLSAGTRRRRAGDLLIGRASVVSERLPESLDCFVRPLSSSPPWLVTYACAAGDDATRQQRRGSSSRGSSSLPGAGDDDAVSDGRRVERCLFSTRCSGGRGVSPGSTNITTASASSSRPGQPRGWGAMEVAAVGSAAGACSIAGVGQLREFASASNPPKQYLRYIHRVKPEAEDAEAGGNSAGPSPTGGGEQDQRALAEGGAGAAPGPMPEGQEEGEVGEGGGGDDESAWQEKEKMNKATLRWLSAFTAEDILRDKTLLKQQLEVRGNCTVDEAITAFVNQRVTSFVVVNRRKEVIGMFTSRDLLGELARYPNKADALTTKAHEFMIPLNRMIYASVNDSLYQCLLVMSELKVRNLPVIAEGKVMGIVNVNDISDFSFSMEELGGKKAYMKNVSQRKGLPKGVGLDPGQNRSGWKQTFSASVGAVALPHPHKMADGGVSANQREHRHLEFADDPTLSEDAHFVLDVAWPTETTDTINYVGVADGVGSWRKVGVDPREFSHRLMHWAREYILSMAPGSGIGGEGETSPPPPKPHEVLNAAWEYTIGEKVVGSSTACVAALDYDLEQLTFSNIGDCGVVVLRHIDSDVAGYMREKKTPRHLRESDLRLAFISQQQLRAFNLPYQFGYTNVPEDNANFETPRDAVNTSFPVRPGDIIILATDGLFDNMELENISSVALEWETKWFGGPMRGLSEHNNAALEDLALTLGHRARELSLDNSRDSPFALLAKENDIMWGGGMPDDITIVALRVIDKADSSSASVSTRGVDKDVPQVHEEAAA